MFHFAEKGENAATRILILDRGLLDGQAIGRLKTEHHINTVIPLKTTWTLTRT